VASLLGGGAAPAIATDFNPGTSAVLSMPEAVALATSLYGVSTPAALTAATANPAWVLGLSDRLGSLEPGKRADFLVLDPGGFRMVPYRPGHNPVRRVFVAGVEVRSRPE
jgi:imidazolonepropionase